MGASALIARMTPQRNGFQFPQIPPKLTDRWFESWVTCLQNNNREGVGEVSRFVGNWTTSSNVGTGRNKHLWYGNSYSVGPKSRRQNLANLIGQRDVTGSRLAVACGWIRKGLMECRKKEQTDRATGGQRPNVMSVKLMIPDYDRPVDKFRP
ncbi:hypothetical protein RRG08_017785 [Elysia crispata]|uniref:Uncharacterized protein n=1 Tax=Elysia crispata TaxID=231223 RepID=A0AAE1ASH1_9GAST|nr:hypothetical protein RRG08_017785 [Elysia crispata]